NGLLLAEKAEALAAAGLRRINVSVDSLLRHRFAEMTRRDALERVLDGLRAAERAGLAPIKLNCVVVRGTNEDEVVDFARIARAVRDAVTRKWAGHRINEADFVRPARSMSMIGG